MKRYEQLGSLLARIVTRSKSTDGDELESGLVDREMGVQIPSEQCLFHESAIGVAAEGALGKSVEGLLGLRCSRIALASAETSGRLLEKLEGPEVEKNRLGGALGALEGGTGGAGTWRGAGGANASKGTRVGCRVVLLKLLLLWFEKRRRLGSGCGSRGRGGDLGCRGGV